MKRGFQLLALLLIAHPISARADEFLIPCVSIPNVGIPPTISVFHPNDTDKAEPGLSKCVGSELSSKTRLVVIVAGSVQFSGTVDNLLTRIGKISMLSQMKYWSVTNRTWRPVANAASALTGPSANGRRNDFMPSEFITGTNLYYWADDSRMGNMVTRLSVRERSSDRFVISTENVTPVKYVFATLFPARTIQSEMIVQRISDDVWGVYLISRILEGSSIFAMGHDDSYVNRAVAFYRQVAGIPTDQSPPARR